MEICLKFAVEFESPDLKMGIIFAVLKHSGKIPSENELLKNIETVVEIRSSKILYISKGTSGLFICLRIGLTISSLSEGRGRKINFNVC